MRVATKEEWSSRMSAGLCPAVDAMRKNALFFATMMILMTLSPLVQASQGRSSACTVDVCINELMPNPAGSESGSYPAGEWVELYNSGTSDVNLQGWALTDLAGYTHPIDANTWVDFVNLATPYVIPAGDYAIIAENNQGTLKLNNAGETLDLIDNNGATVQTVTTGQASSDISKVPGALTTDDFTDSGANTPGATNSGGGTGPTFVQSDIRIAEVMPDPYWSNDNGTWPGGEWVEIANTGQIAVDLAGWTVEDAAGNSMQMNITHLVGSGTIIQPGEHRVVAVNGTRTYGMLNNGAGTELVKLKMPDGMVTHQVEYSGPTKPGHSYVNSTSIIGDWGRNAILLETAKWPTPGQLNSPLDTLPGIGFQINEILTNATGISTGTWVEFYYPDTENAPTIDTSSYSLMTATGRMSQPLPASIQPGEFIVFGPVDLINIYDSLSLVDGNGDVRQTVSWDSPQNANVSIVPSNPLMVDSPWDASDYNTPGALNPGQGNNTGGNNTGGNNTGGNHTISMDIQISEIMPNPLGSDSQAEPNGEWVELYNAGNESIDLTGWKLRSGTGYTLPMLSLDVGEYHVAYLGTHSISLPNNGGTLELSDYDDNLVQTVTWEYSAFGMSMVAGGDPLGPDPWVMAPWSTPGSTNALFEHPYSGPTEILMSEVSAQCSAPENGLTGEWIELLNAGAYPVDLSRWSIRDKSGNEAAVAPDRIWGRTDSSTTLEPGMYAVLLFEENILTNMNESIELHNPNRVVIQSLSWEESTDCLTLESRNGNEQTRDTLWPTPGEVNPIIDIYDGSQTLKFTRFMPTEIDNRANDWFEITNTGTTLVDLNGWRVSRDRAPSSAFNSTFSVTHVLYPGESVVISENPANLASDSGPASIDGMVAFSGNPPHLVNSGGALQLAAPDGTVVDTFVYGSGNAEVVGWTGGSLELPNTDYAGLILMRGDGCGTLPDTNSSADWEYRWLRLGSSLFCDEGIFSTTGSLTPVISPQGSLGQMVNWIGGATESMHIHVYQFDSPELFVAIQEAVNRNVDCTILLEGGILGDADDGASQRGWADELSNIGCNVLWMVEPDGNDAPMAPYRYIHSKVGVIDNSSVWIGSGNWKRSTFPLDGDAANRDTGIIIESDDVAEVVLSRMLWDEDLSHRHIISQDDAPLSMGRPMGWSAPSASSEFTTPVEPMPTFEDSFTGRVLTCPDDCIEGIVWLIDQADDTLEISQQYLYMDWTWGYGENPIIDAIERAARDRDVQVRLLLNGFAFDGVSISPKIRETVDYFNHVLNMTENLDVEARLMSTSENITKLHDKGVIVDGSIVLYSSINWGSNSALRNREMGVAIEHTGLALHRLAIFNEDWERMDSSMDSDGDGMPDIWEVENGLNRTRALIPGTITSEFSVDRENDGLSNLDEYRYGGNPNLNDTDGDCIGDGDEVRLATLTYGVDPALAVQTADADLDGEDDYLTWGCTIEYTDDDDATTPLDEDDDEPGIFREDAMDSGAAKVFLGMIIIAAISLLGAVAMMVIRKQRETAGNFLLDDAEISEEAWGDDSIESTPAGSVILEGTSLGENAGSEAREVSAGRDDGVFGAPQLDGYDFPNWSPQEVQAALDQGWTVEQLREKYDSEQ